MQIEKHIKIVPTPTGAIVFFAGQVCLNISEHSGRFTWSISPVFARLTTGISTCFQVPMAAWDGQPTLAEAIADGLTKLDEMQAFYGVIDMPEDTYVGEHLDEGTDYSGIHGDVKRTGKTHEQLAAEHRAYAKQMRAIGKDGLAVRSEMLANDHDKAIADAKKTNESVEDEDLLIESFVVRQVGQSRTHPARIMISAAAVINRAREMAKEAGEKSHAKFIKLAHADIASNMKAESEEIEGDQIEESFNDTDTVFLTPQTGSMAHMRYNTFKEGSAADHKKAIKYHTKDADRADPKMARFHDMRAKMHTDYLSGKNEEFIQYEDALPEVFQLIKEDCRAEALAMSDSLVEAQQLGNELFEDIVEEYLNELSKDTLASYKGQAITTMSKRIDLIGHPTDPKSVSKMAKVPKIPGLFWDKKRTPTDIKYRARDAERDRIDQGIDRATRKLSEDIVEATHQDLLDDAQKAYVEATRKGNGTMARHYGAEILKHKAIIAKSKKSKLKEEVEELDEAALSGDAYWKSKEAESKEEFLKAQRKALGLPEPVKRGRGKPTLIDRDLLKTRAHSNVEAGKRPTAGFDRNEKIHFVRHLKNHPDFADKHVSQAGRPTGTTKVAKQQQELVKKKQDTAFSMWAGLGKR